MLKPKSFPYNTNLVSEQAHQLHIELYLGYCNKYNEIQEELQEYAGCPDANKNYSRYRGMKKDEAHNLNAITLHEHFFNNLSDKPTSPGKHFIGLINQSFGGFEDWKRDFVSCSKATRGWAVMVFEQRSGRIKNMMIDHHDTGVFMNSYPLLVLDCWEHSYIFDYQNDIDRYISKFLHCADWNVVESRCKVIVEN